MSREAIFAALFNLAKSSSGFQTTSRTLVNPDGIDIAALPALLQEQGEQITQKKVGTGMPSKWQYRASLWIVVAQGEDQNAIPATMLNNALDALELALQAPTVGGLQTLGGLVYDCIISDKIQIHEPTLGSKAIAIVPILILV